MNDTQKVKLYLFNEKVEKLANSTFMQWASQRTHIFPLESIYSRNWIGAEGLTEESINAFILTLRVLIQDSDGISIRCMAELYGEIGSPDQQSKINQQRQRWNDLRAEKSLFKLEGDTENLSRAICSTL